MSWRDAPGQSHCAKLQDLEMQAGLQLARVVRTAEPLSILEAVVQ